MQAMIIEKAKGYLVDNFGNLTSTGGVYFNKETLLNILRIRLSKEKEKVIIKVPAEDLPEIKRVAKDILVL